MIFQSIRDAAWIAGAPLRKGVSKHHTPSGPRAYHLSGLTAKQRTWSAEALSTTAQIFSKPCLQLTATPALKRPDPSPCKPPPESEVLAPINIRKIPFCFPICFLFVSLLSLPNSVSPMVLSSTVYITQVRDPQPEGKSFYDSSFAGASQAAQWYRVHLPVKKMQEMQVSIPGSGKSP